MYLALKWQNIVTCLSTTLEIVRFSNPSSYLNFWNVFLSSNKWPKRILKSHGREIDQANSRKYSDDNRLIGFPLNSQI
jgi:hypothetical protein